MVSTFTLELPKNIYFGPKSREKLFEILNNAGKTVVFITGRNWFEKSGWRILFKEKLKNCLCRFLSCAPGEPDIPGINALLVKVREIKPDFIVGIGGGTVIDSAKACAGLAARPEPVEDFMEGVGKGLVIDKPGIPFIAMPTTAGTGAEATKNSVIISPAHKAKKSIRSPHLLPEYVIVDPEFALELGPDITGMAGMDALVQLFESYVSKKRKPVPISLVKGAFPMMLRSLKKLASDPRDLGARTEAAYGSLISGIALANSGLGGVHGYASSLGGLTDIPHGLICAVFFNPVLEANREAVLPAVTELLPEWKEVHKEKSPGEIFELFKEEIDGLIKLYGLDKAFRNYKPDPAMITGFAEMAKGSSMSGNPVELNFEDKKRIVEKVFERYCR